MWIFRRKASRFVAGGWVIVCTVVATMYAVNAISHASFGYAVTALGWLGVGLTQGYRALFDFPPTALPAEVRLRVRVASYAMLFFFLLMFVGLAIAWSK
jgi:hypothetical protein